ncbi:MAG: hypothetical protein ABI438_07395 [Dermatophilaceae bacterium]
MTDDKLTELLHSGTERMPDAPRPPADVRHSAEHGRRIRRRVVGGVVAGALILALAIGSGLLTKPLSTWLAPADGSTTQSPSTTEAGLFTLAADPLLTVADWAKLTGEGVPTVVRTDAKTQPLLECFTDPRDGAAGTRGFPSAESHAASYLHPGYDKDNPGSTGKYNEYVLRYDKVAEATREFAALWLQFQRCREQTDPAYNVTNTLNGDVPAGIRGPIDEQFGAERYQTPKNTGSGLRPSLYSLIVGRDRNVVIVIESLDGWADRGSWTLEQAMERAIPSERGRCVNGPLGCR